VKLEILTASGKHILHLFTSNVCSGGVLCDTDQVFPIGSEVKVSLLVESERVKKNLGARSLVKVRGRVARCGPEGMAVRFYKDYTIEKIIDPYWQLQ
jgi:Tfp pilus assembly protein PilZ